MAFSVDLWMWLAVGIFCIIAEFFTTGIGLLFLGLGGLSNAVLIYNHPEMLSYQYITFGLLSFLFFIVLWIPLKRYFYHKKSASHHFNIIGSVVYVVNKPLEPSKTGEVLWSDVIMNARLHSTETKAAAIGQALYVQEIQGNILFCTSEIVNITNHKS